MSVLAAITGVLAVITVLHLLVTYGLVRRLRAHTSLLSQLAGTTGRLLPAGTPIPAFAARALDGHPITEASLRHPAAVALLTVDCPACRTSLPDFVAYIQGGGYTRDHVLAVIATHEHTDPTARQHMLDTLAPVATVVCEPSADGAITTAFNTQAFPAFYLTSPQAILTAASHIVRQLPTPQLPTQAR